LLLRDYPRALDNPGQTTGEPASRTEDLGCASLRWWQRGDGTDRVRPRTTGDPLAAGKQVRESGLIPKVDYEAVIKGAFNFHAVRGYETIESVRVIIAEVDTAHIGFEPTESAATFCRCARTSPIYKVSSWS